MRALRVLHVGDGGPGAASVAAALGADPALDLVGRAANAAEGATLLAMPGRRPADVVVTHGGGRDSPAHEALERAAASAGAAVVEAPPGPASPEMLAALCARVRRAGGRDDAPPRAAAQVAPVALRAPPPAEPRLIAIGASTGGVEALTRLLAAFPVNCPPTVVVQHMPAFFTASLAARLDAICPPRVREAWDGAPLDRGVIYVAPGGANHLEVRWGADRRCRLLPTPPVHRCRPSVDVLFHSVAREVGAGALGALLTGMGRDGAEGLLAMRAAGARTLAQDRDSATVWGMPRAALELGAADAGTPLDRIAAAIFDAVALQKEAV